MKKFGIYPAFMSNFGVGAFGKSIYPSARAAKPGVDRSHTCYQKRDKRVRMLWPAAWGTYIRAEHGKIGGES